MPAADIQAAIERIDVRRAKVRHVWTILVRAEDTCLSVFEAADVQAVIQATARADFPFDRVSEVTPVLASPPGPS
jgi:hypothetical protein